MVFFYDGVKANLECQGDYSVGAEELQENRSVMVNLNDSQKTTAENYILNIVLPCVKAKESIS